MVMEKFGGGGGVIEVYYGIVQVVNRASGLYARDVLKINLSKAASFFKPGPHWRRKHTHNQHSQTIDNLSH